MTALKKYIKEVINLMFDGIDNVPCLNCEEPTYIRYDRKYKGLVGSCTKCDISWRES